MWYSHIYLFCSFISSSWRSLLPSLFNRRMPTFKANISHESCRHAADVDIGVPPPLKLFCGVKQATGKSSCEDSAPNNSVTRAFKKRLSWKSTDASKGSSWEWIKKNNTGRWWILPVCLSQIKHSCFRHVSHKVLPHLKKVELHSYLTWLKAEFN